MNALALVFYTLGYSVWFISSHFYPNNTPKKDEWYGFAQFKEQYLYSAALGIIGTTLSLAALALPVLIVPAAWIFLAANLMWTAAENNKLNNPPPTDENYSKSHQEAYLSYTLTITIMSAIAAVGATLAFLFPPIAISLFIITSILTVGLTVLAGDIWLGFTFGDHKPTSIENSHDQMNKTLGPITSPTETVSPAPFHGKDLFNSSIELQPLPESILNPLPTQTCSMP